MFLQVNISGDENKSGFIESEIMSFMTDTLPNFSNLRFKGLMTITRLYEEREDVRLDYRAMADLKDSILSAEQLDIDTLELSMGMSHDFDIAIEEGATLVRVGSAIFGERSVSTT